MTAPDTLPALLERLRATKEADRELDRAIYVALYREPEFMTLPGGQRSKNPLYRWPPESLLAMSICPEFSRSLDAALSLVEAKLPGWTPVVTCGRDPHARLDPPDQAGPSAAELGVTPALALCAALVAALIGQGEGAVGPEEISRQDDPVERRAIEMHDALLRRCGHDPAEPGYGWENTSPGLKEQFRADARVALATEPQPEESRNG